MSEKLVDPDPAHIVMDNELVPPPTQKRGFLPIETNWFDRIFISVVIWIAMSLLWFRFVEPFGISIWFCNVIALCMAIVMVRKG